MRKYRKIIICALVLAMVMLLSGCIKMHIDIVWNEDNTGTLSMTMGVSTPMVSMMGSPEEIREQLRESMVGVDDDFRIRDLDDDDYTGIIATRRIDDVTKNDAEAVEQISFKYSESGGKKTYTVSGEYDSSDSMGDMGDMEEMGMSMGDFDMKMSITMPGRIVSHNATQQVGNKLIWDLTEATVMDIRATSEVSGGGFLNILFWVLFILSILVLIFSAAVVVLQKKNR